MKDYTNSQISHLIDGVLYEPLAEEFGLSVVQTKNVVYKLQNKIFKFL